MKSPDPFKSIAQKLIPKPVWAFNQRPKCVQCSATAFRAFITIHVAVHYSQYYLEKLLLTHLRCIPFSQALILRLYLQANKPTIPLVVEHSSDSIEHTLFRNTLLTATI